MTDEGHRIVGRYRLIRRIGAGAMGVVWQGHDELLDRPVAVKKVLLRPGLSKAKAAEAVARCLREGRIAARLQHPNAVTVFDVVDENDVPHLVMEYIPSRSLAAAIVEEGRLAPVDVAAIGAHVATALAAAHEAGIVHRDVTPGNILLGEDGAVKLTDFGISRATDDVTVTGTGFVAGTPAYLAPEVALGTEPTPASDVFSLGATLYAAVEGEPPFGHASNVLALLHAVAGGEINPPRWTGPLTDVLLALLTTSPSTRPTAAQAHDLLAAAGEMSANAPPQAVATTPDNREPVDAAALIAAPIEVVHRKPSQPPTAPAATGRSHKPMAAAGVLVVVLAAVGLWLLGSHNSMSPGQHRDPADGGGGPTTRTSGTAPVTPVGEPIDIDKTPSTKTSKSHAAAKTGGSAAVVPTAGDHMATPPPTTTTDAAEQPTTSVATTTPPTSSEATPTAPS